MLQDDREQYKLGKLVSKATSISKKSNRHR